MRFYTVLAVSVPLNFALKFKNFMSNKHEAMMLFHYVYNSFINMNLSDMVPISHKRL